MIKKIVKHTFIVTLTLLMVCVLLILFLINSTVGARWVFDFLSSEDKTVLQFSGIEGSIANELKLSQLHYKDDALHIVAKNVAYKIADIQWFSGGVVFEMVGVDSLMLRVSETNENVINNDKKFEGLILPLGFKIEQSFVNAIDVQLNGYTEQFHDLNFSVKGNEQSLKVVDFSVKHDLIDIDADGEVILSAELDYDVVAKFNANDMGLSGSSRLTGNMSELKSHHNFNLANHSIDGDYVVVLDVELLKDGWPFYCKLTSDQTQFRGVNAEINTLNIEMLGDMYNYHIKGSSIAEYNDLTEHLIQIDGDGNIQSLSFNQFSVRHGDGLIYNLMNIDWKDNISINSQMTFTNINPEIYIKDWHGVVDGTVNFQGEYYAHNDFELSVSDIDFIGELKDQEFKLMGSAQVQNGGIDIDNGYLALGDNKVTFAAKTVDDNVSGDFDADINDLSLINQDFKGKIMAQIALNGQWNEAHTYELSGLVKANDIKYKDVTADGILMHGKGGLSSMMDLSLSGSHIRMANQELDELAVNLLGTVDEQQINIELKNKMLTSTLKAQGHWDQKNNMWSGTVNQHDIYPLTLNALWHLNDQIDVQLGSDLSISRSCWVEKYSNAQVCMNLNSQNDYKHYQGHLQLEKFALEPFHHLMPPELIISGNVDGETAIEVTGDDVIMNTRMELNEGALKYAMNDEESHITKILKAQFVAEYDNASFVNTNIQLDDGSYISMTSDILPGKNNWIELDGTLEGRFTNSRYLSSLTTEIKEMTGETIIDGTIKGALSRPQLAITAKQSGHVVLERLGSQLQNLSINLKNGSETGAFNYDISADTDSGSLSSHGDISLSKINKWQVNGRLAGRNFRLLTLPEIELNISPELDYLINDNQLMVTGDVYIPYGAVKIKTLPDSAVGVSPDVVIHNDMDNENTDVDELSVLFDINTHLQKPVKLNAVGLNTELTGNLRVSNLENPSIDGHGKLQLLNGEYTIYGQTLDITQGELVFNGPISNPSIDVLANRKSISNNVVAGVKLGGTINKLQSELYSEPQLTDLEILSYLITGSGLNQSVKLNSERLVQAALLLGLKKSSPVFSQIQSSLGIDVLTIKEGATTQQSSIEAGKNINENIYIGYNHGLFNRIGFWVLRYQLSESLRLETSQGENQSFDLIYVRKKK